MLRIRNTGAKAFAELIQHKKLYFFGAGKLTENCVDIYCQGKKAEAIIDNNEKLCGTEKKIKGQSLLVINVGTFIKRLQTENLEDIVLMIVPSFFAVDIVAQLDKIPQLDGLNCYIHALVRNTKEPVPEFSFTSGIPKIPKMIHYFWVGGNPVPEYLQNCIDSWKKYNPDYEIIRWDEKNYDFSKNQYMKEAYKSKAWGFVPDYARLDVIYQYGGIYLDTDVEVIRSLDVLLCDDAFFGMGSADRINMGVGFGSIARNSLIEKLRDYYDDKHFINPDGSLNRVPCYYYQHPIFEQYGFRIRNEYQKVNGAVVYPPEVMSPKGSGGSADFFSEKTVSIHHGSGTWVSKREKQGLEELKKLLLRAEKNIEIV